MSFKVRVMQNFSKTKYSCTNRGHVRRPWKTRYLIRSIIKTKWFKEHGGLRGAVLPLCLSGILLGEITFDNTKHNLRTSCLHLLECHVTGLSPPLTVVNASSIWGFSYWKWLRWWVYAEQSLWHQEILFPKSFNQDILGRLVQNIWALNDGAQSFSSATGEFCHGCL